MAREPALLLSALSVLAACSPSPTPPRPALASSTVGVDAPGATAVVGHPMVISVVLKDERGRPLPPWNVRLLASGSRNTLAASAGSTDATGLWQSTLTSQTAERKALTVQVAANPDGDPASGPLFTLSAEVTFGPGPLSAAASTAVPSPARVMADGRETSTVVFTARDEFGNPIPGLPVSVSGVPRMDLATPASGMTSASGTFQALVASDAVGTRSITFGAAGLTTSSSPIEFAAPPWSRANGAMWGGFIDAVAVPPAGGPAGLAFVGTPGGVYRTTDGGTSWVAASLGIDGADVRGLTVASVDGSVVLASVLGGPAGNGIYLSQDGGGTWRPSLVGPGQFEIPTLTSVWDPGGAVTLYCLVLNPVPFEVRRSVDRGVSWTTLGALPSAGGLVPLGLAADPRRGTVYALSDTLYRYDGQSWVAAGTGLPVRTLASLTVESSQDPAVVWVGTNGQGVYRGVGDPSVGLSFTPTAGGALGLPAADYRALAADPATPDLVYAATGSQVYRTTDAGASWHPLLDLGITDWITQVLVDPRDHTVGWFAGGLPPLSASGSAGLWKSNDLLAPSVGVIAAPVITGVDAQPGALLAEHPGVPGTLALASRSLYQTTDGGATWTDLVTTGQVNPGLVPGHWTGIGYDATGALYAASGAQVVRVAGGALVAAGASPNPLSSFGVSPALTGTFFGFDFIGLLWRCSDPCATWTPAALPAGLGLYRLAFARSAPVGRSPPV
jgi:hypothetical protein